MEENFVIDNSFAMAWCFKDESYKHSDNILSYLEENIAFVPSI